MIRKPISSVTYFWQLQTGLWPPCSVDDETCRIGLDFQGGATAASIDCSCPVDQVPPPEPTQPQPASPQDTSPHVTSHEGSHDCSQVGSQQLGLWNKRLRKQPRLRIRSHGKLMHFLRQPPQLPTQLPHWSHGSQPGGLSA